MGVPSTVPLCPDSQILSVTPELERLLMVHRIHPGMLPL